MKKWIFLILALMILSPFVTGCTTRDYQKDPYYGKPVFRLTPGIDVHPPLVTTTRRR